MNQRVAVVTGASGGIGSAIAVALSKAGFTVAVNYLSNQSSAEEVVKIIQDAGGSAMIAHCDVTSENEVRSMIESIVERFRRLDVLVNNAGAYVDSVVWKMDMETWSRVLDVNLTGAFLCARAAIPHLRRSVQGRIVNISSVVGSTGAFGTANYSAAKAGIYGFTKSVAREVARFGITVNCLALGYFETGMFLRLPERIREEIIRGIALGRPGRLSEVTGPLLFLVSSDASYITGQVIHVNGGWYM